MAGAGGTSRKPVHRKAWLGFAVAVVALILAWYGSLHAEKHLPRSPLHEARGVPPVLPEPGSWYERAWDRAEVRIFGGRVDQKVLAITERSSTARYSVQVIAYWLPLLMGIAAAWIGGAAMRAIEQSRDVYAGNFQAVFSIMMGGFASVIAGCMIVSIYIWPHVPSFYTQ
jgi:hypothetical protein